MLQNFSRPGFIVLLLLVTICSTGFVSAQQAAKAETYKILGVSVEGNNPRSGTESSAIIANSGLRVGDAISIPGDQIHQAVMRLWALHIFSDVQILVDNKVGDGIYLLIHVVEYPRLNRVIVTGADDVSEDDIRKKIHLMKGQIVTPQEDSRIVKDLQALYEEEGHLLAEITSRQVPADSGSTVNLEFSINEGPSITIANVSFTGNAAFSGNDLKGQLEDTHERSWWQIFSHPKFERKKFEKDKEKLLKFYRNNGYLDAEVVSDSEWYTPDKKHVNVLIAVREGLPYSVRSVRWDGNVVYTSDVLNQHLQFYPGMRFNEERFDQNLRGNQEQTDVASLYLDNGYLKFNIDPEITRVGRDSLDLTIHIYERNQFRIGHVDIKGNRKTKENVIRRELFTIPGRYFSRADIYRSLRQLQQLNYFNPEKLKPDTKIVDDETVDLAYEVEEKSSDNVNASVGYSGAFGITGALGFTINNFSLVNPLEGGAGQVLNFDWQFGEGSRYQTFQLSFTEPWLFDRPTTLGVSLYDTREQYTIDLRQTGVSARLGKRLTWPDNYFRIDWTTRFQRLDVINNGGSQYYENGLTSQFSVTQSISRNSTDSPIFPAQGSSVSLSVELSGGPLLPGNVSYHKWLFNAEWYTPLFNTNRLVLYSGTFMGYIGPIGDAPHIPYVEKFFMGGTGIGYISTTPLRGYEDRSVGPLDNYSREIGGNVITKHTAELRLAVTLNPIPIYFLTFAEAGNVFQDFRRTDFFDLKRSYGFGARLLIQPIGMIGFDYGYGLDHVLSTGGGPEGWRFHFQFGRGF